MNIIFHEICKENTTSDDRNVLRAIMVSGYQAGYKVGHACPHDLNKIIRNTHLEKEKVQEIIKKLLKKGIFLYEQDNLLYIEQSYMQLDLN